MKSVLRVAGGGAVVRLRLETPADLRVAQRWQDSDDPLSTFIKYCVNERGLTVGTAGTYVQGLKRMERFSGKPFTFDIEQRLVPADLRRFFRESGTTPYTKHSTLTACKQWEHFGGIEEWWIPNGIVSLRPPLQHANEPQAPLTPAQVHLLFDAARRKSEARLVWLGLYAGCRVHESGQMGSDHYLGDRLRFVGKGSKRRDVPIHPEVKAIKRAIFFEHLGNGKQLQRACRELRDRAGFYFTTHQLRDTFAQRLLDLDIALPVVESLLGHSHKSMTLRAYATIPWHQKVQAIRQLHY